MVALWVMLAACQPVPAQSLDDIEFPPGFSLDTQRELPLVVRVAPGAEGTPLLVRTPAGEPLYEGSAGFAAAHPVTLAVPGTADRLEVVQGAGADARSTWIDATGAVATVELGG